MYANKFGVVACLDKDVVESFDDGVMAFLYKGVMVCFYKNNKDCFYVDFILAHPLEWRLEGTLGEKFIFHYGYMKKISWSETYAHFYHEHNYKNLMIYQARLNDGRERGWSKTYIHFSHHHQHFTLHCERKSG